MSEELGAKPQMEAHPELRRVCECLLETPQIALGFALWGYAKVLEGVEDPEAMQLQAFLNLTGGDLITDTPVPAELVNEIVGDLLPQAMVWYARLKSTQES